MPDKVTPLWETWRRWSDPLPEHIGPYTQGFTVRSLACADEVEARMKRVRERLDEYMLGAASQAQIHAYDAVFKILREEGMLG